ncbi:hypothetical protein ACFSBZ_00380 [Amnibacterium flavum]|uniref:Uncharacterized protein n=1 Tax=Amnibacterium flavum TaxID=2173173 RepID=A0A2V1HLW5_9MICO|nr:hypothetical protein [Amnibacterium flavum]PVZ93613.1 hypothetical protein DDQ50_15010 [Amnibacterium flavum]
MIDWLSLLTVAVVALVASCVLVALFATGIKLFSTPPPDVAYTGSARDDETDDVAGSTRPLAATIGGIACFALAALGVLYGVYLIVPALHG